MSKSNDAGRPDLFERVEPGSRKAHKRRILACALECFDEEGIDGATIEAIRVRAGSSIGSIYHHFGNKEGLAAALYFAALDDQLALVKPRMEAAADARESVEALVRTYIEWVTEQPTFARFMLRARYLVAHGPAAAALAERNRYRYGALFQWISQGVEAGVIRPLPRETYAPLLLGQSENYCRAWLSGRINSSPLSHVDLFVEAAWRAIAT